MVQVRLAQKRLIARDICSFELVSVSGEPLPAFAAGAHIDVSMPNGLTRQYSLCNNPDERHRYVIGVLRDPKSRGGSVAMHELEFGQTLQISEPRNHFPLSHGARHSVLLAGGIGITPLLSMAESLLREGASFELHCCARGSDRIAFRERLEESDLTPFVSIHLDEGPVVQRLEARALFGAPPCTGTHVYVCGPAGFIEHVLQTALAAGFPENHLHREYFAAAAFAARDPDHPFRVRLASSGEEIEVDADQTVVAALSARGIDVPVSCEQGVCGTCLTRVLEGVPDHRDCYLTDGEKKESAQFLPCCSRSKSELLVLDL